MSHRRYLPLSAAAEEAYRALTGRQHGPIHPMFLEAAADALSVFVPFHPGPEGLRVERSDFATGLERLRRAGVRFSEVRP